MTRRTTAYKVPGGKLIRVQASVESGLITEIKITGDFFLLPSNAIVDLERRLRGLPVEADFRALIADYFWRERIMAAGVTAEDFAAALARALREGCNLHKQP
ncbi:MAG: lipoate protein ligase C-terminal domain-containing protein [Candidatus Bathyarchaeia archaeon]